MKSTKISILGAGSWGSTLALLAHKNKANDVILYGNQFRDASNEKGFLTTPDIKIACKKADLIVLVVPTYAMNDVLEKMPTLSKNQPLIHGSKGFDPKTGKRMSEIIARCTKVKTIGVLSGPNLSSEISLGLPAATVIASNSTKVISLVQKTLSSPTFRIYGNNDIVGVEWVGALKNVLAIASGICQSLQLGQNAQAMLVTRGIHEISKLILKMGGKKETLLGLAGIGDIFATCTSIRSRNYQAGTWLAKGLSRTDVERKVEGTIEGFGTIDSVVPIAKKKKIEMPITEALHRLINSKEVSKHLIQKIMYELMTRPLRKKEI